MLVSLSLSLSLSLNLDPEASSPLCILMEYAAYGSMKDYLAYCRRVTQAHAEGLTSPTLEEAYPLAAASSGAILRQSMLMGDYPQLQPLSMRPALGGGGGGGEGGHYEGNDYLYDPMVAARTRRLLQMLKIQGYSPEEAGGEGPPTAYNHLAAPSGAEAAGVSLYDKLYPNSQCVYRPCLEAYNYACYRGAQTRRDNHEQEYYNATAGGIIEEGEEEEEAPKVPREGDISPFSTTTETVQLIRASPAPQVTITNGPSTRPPPSLSISTPVHSKTKLGPTLSTPQVSSPGQDHPGACASLSASRDNVFESPSGSTNLVAPSKEHLRESMISFPDGYIYAPPPTEGESEGGLMITGAGGAVGGVAPGLRGEEMAELKKEKEPAPPMEEMITDLDMIDFGLQIARGMDHLEKMQVSLPYFKTFVAGSLVPCTYSIITLSLCSVYTGTWLLATSSFQRILR